MLSFLRSRSLREGFVRGRRGWTIVGIIVWGARLVRRVAGRRPDVVSVESIEPGHGLVISSVERPRRRGRPS